MELVDRFTFLSYLVIGWIVLLQLQVHYNFTYLLIIVHKGFRQIIKILKTC